VRNPLWPATIAYFAICAVSIGANGLIDGTASSLLQMVLYMVVAVYVFSSGIREPREVFPAFYALVAGCLGLVGMLIIARDNYAFGIHKNTLGDSISMGVLVSVGLWVAESDKKRRRRIGVVLAILSGGLVFTLSRGAWLGAIAGILVILALRGEWKKSLKIAAAAVPVVAIVWLLLPAQSKEYATDIGTDAHNTQTRLYSLEYCWQLFQQSPIIGVGPGLRKTYDATNLIMMVLSETGVLGLVAFMAVFGVFAVVAWKAARRLESKDPALVLLTIGAALMAGKFVHGMVDHYWVRGMIPVWAGAGLVIYAYDRSRRRT
jgi:O-antigen ligase